MSTSHQFFPLNRSSVDKAVDVFALGFDRCPRASISILLATLLAVFGSIAFQPHFVMGQDGNGTVAADVAGDRYESDLASWRQVMIDAYTIRNQFSLCEEHEAAGLRKNWSDKIAEGDQILRQLRFSSLDKFISLEEPDEEIGRFLVAMANKDVADQQYELAAPAFNAVIASGFALQDTDLNGAGIASFSTNDFDLAEKYLRKADELHVLEKSPMGPGMLSRIAGVKAAWNHENLLRQLELANNDLPLVRLVTNQGEMVVELFENDAPNTVANFISLAEQGFYDGQYFFQVNGYFASTGCPQGDGKGGPGYYIQNEVTPQKYRGHFRGSLTMISDDHGQAGSRFSICKLPMPALDTKLTCFGRIISGIECLGKLKSPDGEMTEEEIGKLLRVEVTRKRDHQYQPDKAED